MRYENKVVLVTGGAAGVGRATVLKFAAEGAKVVFTDLDGKLGEGFAAELKAAGHDVLFTVSNATDEQDVQRLIATVVATYGRLDVAINNVGNMAGGDRVGLKLHETPAAAFEGTLSVSLRSTFYAMKYEIEQMLKQGGGVIANTVSVAGMMVFPGASTAYGAAKAGGIHLTRTAATQYAQDNIRINAVAPGVIETPGMRAAVTPEVYAGAAGAHPMNRLMVADEIADAFLYLCSDAASAVTGVILPVDGGATAA
ncbi:SDR family NAD(P)-dependent oxidoreductase [Micromonospora rubida]|uniref:SDR family NAD(P)-dependent oxidoreductase n=1 Tax=Micromonospora rubida TaxID=2697657 RepID=UPI001378EB7B|nr:SDR family oxidoreductase [Micromonospora rubida]NBE79586.1 SDR family oxidoreductase [Micromonospora rubida]